MNISKAGRALSGGAANAAEMELIRGYARGELDAQDVYTFSVVLCDNEVDRDFECFDEDTLEELAALFLGKTGISDHEWRSGNQVARIFRTEIVRAPARKTADGRDYVCLKAWAYMLRTDKTAALIADIEGGIKKEVSVGCSVSETVCSICGAHGGCTHIPGERYDGKLCFSVLHGASDAYEWSFVAVPAQRGAGVTKAMGNAENAEFAKLRKEAALGRMYLGEMRTEAKRLALICGRDLYDALAPAMDMMEAEKLMELKKALEKRVAEKLPLRSQFPAAEDQVPRFDGAAYRV